MACDVIAPHVYESICLASKSEESFDGLGHQLSHTCLRIADSYSRCICLVLSIVESKSLKGGGQAIDSVSTHLHLPP